MENCYLEKLEVLKRAQYFCYRDLTIIKRPLFGYRRNRYKTAKITLCNIMNGNFALCNYDNFFW